MPPNYASNAQFQVPPPRTVFLIAAPEQTPGAPRGRLGVLPLPSPLPAVSAAQADASFGGRLRVIDPRA